MFLSCRSAQAEYFDTERPQHEVAEFFRSLDRLNRWFAFAEPFQRLLPQLIMESGCASLSILDLGAGDGSLGKVLSRWALKRGWHWRVINLDSNLTALELNRDGGNVAGTALALPFRDQSFDVVIASQMLHHLRGTELKQLLRESGRVARNLILFSDLHRNAALYFTLWGLFSMRRFPRSFCNDALLSVKRSWRVKELRALLAEADILGAQVSLYFGARIVVHARRPPVRAVRELRELPQRVWP